MAVSKATLNCVKGEIGTRLIADIKSASINRDAIKECKSLLKKLKDEKINRYCSIEDSLETSLRQMKLIKNKDVDQKSWGDICSELKK